MTDPVLAKVVGLSVLFFLGVAVFGGICGAIIWNFTEGSERA